MPFGGINFQQKVTAGVAQAMDGAFSFVKAEKIIQSIDMVLCFLCLLSAYP